MQKNKSIIVIILSAVVLAISGCASLPSPELMKADLVGYELPKLPEPGKAIVYVVRPSGIGGLVRFNVFVDDQEATSEMGHTRSSQYIYFNLAPGEHKIFSKAENWAELSIKAEPGDILYIQQEPSMGLIMARNAIFKLEDYQGKYHVKRLTVGTILKTDKSGSPQAFLPPSTSSQQTQALAPSTLAKSTSSASGPGTASASSRSERMLDAGEVRSHLATASEFTGLLSNGTKVKFEWTWGSGFAVSSQQGSDRLTGTSSVQDNQVCLRIANIAASRQGDLMPLGSNACYGLFQTGNKGYAWRGQAPADGVVLSYTLP